MSHDVISRVHAREVLDSRGNPTVEVEVFCRGGAHGRAIVPAGASTGRHEAVELRDNDPHRYGGKGVRLAVQHVRETIAPGLVGWTVTDQAGIDDRLISLDGTANKSRLGANAILGVSLACAQAAAHSQQQTLWRYLAKDERVPTLPLPMINLISGGLHAGGNLDFQDFLLLPIGADSYSQALEMTWKVYRTLSQVLSRHGYEGVLVGDEGGFGPHLPSNELALQLVLEAMETAGLDSGEDAAIALDVASTHFYRDGAYHLASGTVLNSEELVELLIRWTTKYPILSIEDGVAEDDWDGWKLLTESIGKRIQLIGDDLFVTNPRRLSAGIKAGVANSVLVKLNQVGTLTETLRVLAMAREAGYRPVISARSGETEDTTMADLAVGTAAGQIKIGSIARSERLAKYNQLLRIEEELGAAHFARWQPVAAT